MSIDQLDNSLIVTEPNTTKTNEKQEIESILGNLQPPNPQCESLGLGLSESCVPSTQSSFKEASDYFEAIFENDPNLRTDDAALADKLDSLDTQAPFRSQFILPRHPHDPSKTAVYLTGNSLGAQPKETTILLQQELNVWGEMGVLGHTQHRWDRPWVEIDYLCDTMLAPLLGAKATEIGMMNSLTVNLHLLLGMFYRPKGQKIHILMERNAFPSDHYVVQSHLAVVAQLSGRPEVADAIMFLPGRNQLQFQGKEAKSDSHFQADQFVSMQLPDTTLYDSDEILEFIKTKSDSIALILLPGVQYLTGQAFNIAAITSVAHAHDIKVGFDLAHAVGNLPLSLHEWQVDFAAWCSYKYLNAGPGAIGGFFLHEKYHSVQLEDLPYLTGWWGNTPHNRFQMSPRYTMIEGAKKLQHSNPSVLAIIPLYASLKIFHETSIKSLFEKSRRMSFFLRQRLIQMTKCAEAGRGSKSSTSVLTILTPAEDSGAQFSLAWYPMPEGRTLQSIVEAFLDKGIIVDEREPCIIRVTPAPLYSSYKDCLRFLNVLQSILNDI